MQVVSNGKLREITRDGYNEVNKSFKKKTGTEFNEALNEVKEPKITKKKKKKKKIQNFNENKSCDKSIASK